MVKYPWASKSGQLLPIPGLKAQEKEPLKTLVRSLALGDGCWTQDVAFGRGSIHFHALPSREGAKGINMATSFSSNPTPPRLLLVPSTDPSKEAREAVDAAHSEAPQKHRQGRWKVDLEG